MRIVKCYECGKRYNYDEDGFCPNCGAFNQPPRTSRIGADGSVIRVEGINCRNHEGSFVHQEYHAENRERRGTALEQDEKPLHRPQAQTRMTHKGSARKAKRGKIPAPVVILLVFIVLNLLSGLFPLLGRLLSFWFE